MHAAALLYPCLSFCNVGSPALGSCGNVLNCFLVFFLHVAIFKKLLYQYMSGLIVVLILLYFFSDIIFKIEIISGNKIYY